MSTSGIDKAVILAAGRGIRLSSLGSGIPKPLLPLDGRSGGPTFLDWHVRALAAVGVREIYIVGNWATCGAHVAAMDETDVTWILNPTDDLSTSGSAHSFHLALESAHGILDGHSRVLLMDADIFYDPKLLHRLAATPSRGTLDVVSRRHDANTEEVVVYVAPESPQWAHTHGKGLAGTPMVEALVPIGEATGLVLFVPADHARVQAISHWLMRSSTARQRSEHEDLTQALMRLNRVEVLAFDDLPFMECDTPDDYDHLVHTLYPAIREKLDRVSS